MIGPRLVNRLWLAGARRHHRALRAALAEPEVAQWALLRRILRANADSEIGRRFGFANLDSPKAFRRRVPLRRYAEMEPEIDAIRAGRPAVLTREPVLRLVPSGGSTGAQKLIPFTRSLGRDFARAVGGWMLDLVARYPAVRSGPAYWSLTPAMDLPDLDSAVDIGFESDAAYLGRWLQPLLARTLVGSPALRHVRPLCAFQYATLRFLLAAKQLRLISIWHPSFLDLLLAARDEGWDSLVRDIHQGTLNPPEPLDPQLRRAVARHLSPDPQRAKELSKLGPQASVASLWPHLAVVSAWGDGAARSPFSALAGRLGEVAAQPKGLLATEAFVSLPFAGRHPLAVTSTYIELLDDAGEVHGIHQAEVGATYEVVVTTSGGLYRYRLGDLVRVDGRVRATPSVRLVGRCDRVVDRVGEKLSEAFVGAAIARAYGGEALPPFAMLAPEGNRYCLFVDRRPRNPRALRRRLTAALRASGSFAYAQDLGQLAPIVLVLVASDAPRRYLAHRHEQGQTLGDIKPTALADEGGWTALFEGVILDGACSNSPTTNSAPR